MGLLKTRSRQEDGEGNCHFISPFMNYVIWESTDAFKHGFESPEFQAQLKQYPPGTEVSGVMFQRVAVPGMCLGEPVASD